MKAITSIIFTASKLILSPPLLAHAVTWNEFAAGDLPTSLGTLSPGTNRIIGAIGIDGGFGTGEFIDSDWVQFIVPNGLLLEQFIVRSVWGDDVAVALDRGTTVGADTVEYGIFGYRETPIDLLRFDSSPGVQSASTFIFSVGPAGDTSFRRYTLDLVVTPVPEPGVVLLFAASLPLLLFKLRRFGVDCAA